MVFLDRPSLPLSSAPEKRSSVQHSMNLLGRKGQLYRRNGQVFSVYYAAIKAHHH
jgi:hypothetical protein